MKKGEKYIIEIGEIEYFEDDNGKRYPVARIKGFSSLVFDQKGLDRLEKIEDTKLVKNEPYNCKFVVTESNNANRLTVGKIYTLENGKFYDDIDNPFPLHKDIYSFKDLETYFKRNYSLYPVEILEIKE